MDPLEFVGLLSLDKRSDKALSKPADAYSRQAVVSAAISDILSNTGTNGGMHKVHGVEKQKFTWEQVKAIFNHKDGGKYTIDNRDIYAWIRVNNFDAGAGGEYRGALPEEWDPTPSNREQDLKAAADPDKMGAKRLRFAEWYWAGAMESTKPPPLCRDEDQYATADAPCPMECATKDCEFDFNVFSRLLFENGQCKAMNLPHATVFVGSAPRMKKKIEVTSQAQLSFLQEKWGLAGNFTSLESLHSAWKDEHELDLMDHDE